MTSKHHETDSAENDDFSTKRSEITQPIVTTELLRRMTARFNEDGRIPKETSQGMPAIVRPPFRSSGDDE